MWSRLQPQNIQNLVLIQPQTLDQNSAPKFQLSKWFKIRFVNRKIIKYYWLTISSVSHIIQVSATGVSLWVNKATDVEFVKCFTPAKFPIFNLTREKRVNFWQEIDNGRCLAYLFRTNCQFLCNFLLKYTGRVDLCFNSWQFHQGQNIFDQRC